MSAKRQMGRTFLFCTNFVIETTVEVAGYWIVCSSDECFAVVSLAEKKVTDEWMISKRQSPLFSNWCNLPRHWCFYNLSIRFKITGRISHGAVKLSPSYISRPRNIIWEYNSILWKLNSYILILDNLMPITIEKTKEKNPASSSGPLKKSVPI